MNILQKGMNMGAMVTIFLTIVVAGGTQVFAQSDTSGYGCDLCDTGWSDTSYTDSYAPSTGWSDTSYADSYAPSTGWSDTSYVDSYVPSTGWSDTSYADSYVPSTGWSDTSYADSYAPSYDSYNPSYSYSNPSYSYGGSCGCSTPSYSYSTPTYSPHIYTTPGTGYSYNPSYSYTTPISYIAPTGVQQQQQQQQTTTTTPQPIIINNTNTNTNNNPNTNTLTNYAPVTPVAVAPVQYPASYVYPTYQPTYQNPLSCSIYASQNSIGSGMPTTLSWTSIGATSAYLSDGIGSVTTNGTLVARPSNSTNYILTVYGPQGNRATCNVTISVGGSSVSLTQIPYTGFDFGPVGNSIYWAAIIAFAVAAAYLLVYYRGGAFALATEMIRGRSTFKPVTFTDKPVAAAHVTHEVVATPATPVVNARLASVAQSFSSLPVAETRRATSDAMIVSHAKGNEAPRIIITRE